jgi:hypothetical protein
MSSPNTGYSLKLHYHIRWWSPSSSLDWQAFASREEAETVAKELVRENETYTIDTASVGCKRCLEAAEQAVRRDAAYNGKRTKTHRTA